MKNITRIRKALENDEILEKIFRKRYLLLSEYEQKMLAVYLHDKRLIKYRKAFVYSFISRLKEMKNELENRYMEILKRIIDSEEKSLKLEKGVVKNIDFEMPTETTLINKPTGFSRDAYFNDLIADENYEELFNLYSIDQVIRDSDLFSIKKIM